MKKYLALVLIVVALFGGIMYAKNNQVFAQNNDVHLPVVAQQQDPESIEVLAAVASNIFVKAGDVIACQNGGRITTTRLSKTQMQVGCGVVNTPVPTSTNTPVVVPTNTPVVNTPIPGGGPFAGAPECTEHNKMEWHGLWNAQKQCHYTHEHKHDPNELNHIFGPPGAWFGGTSMSYPWQTFGGGSDGIFVPKPTDPNDSRFENNAKHELYGWIVRKNIPGSGVWIKDFRVQYHGGSTAHDITTRYHSISVEAQICHSATNKCGIVRRGGWIDFGRIIPGSHVGEFTPLAPCDLAVESSSRFRFHYTLDYDPPNIPEFFWYGSNAPVCSDANNGFDLKFALSQGDTWGLIDQNDLHTDHLFCPDYKCDKNGSTIQAHVLHLYSVAHRHDLNNDGFIDNQNKYTNRYGEFNESCTSVGLDCIPFIYENVPLGDVQHRDDERLGYGPKGEKDFDVSPAGEWWIKFPN